MNGSGEGAALSPVRWENDAVLLLDQRRLPAEERWLVLDSVADVTAAIRDMAVRGAPAIGITAAYGVVLAVRAARAAAPESWPAAVVPLLDELAAARPTAVNLRWAVARMRGCFAGAMADPVPRLLAEARRIHGDDVAGNRRIGQLGAALLQGEGVLTHCNAGALATGGYGTALGVIRAAHAHGRIGQVFAGETRPWLQGSRLTAWELLRDGIPVTLVGDSTAASLMGTGRIGWVIVGADRIAANGDVANKIGTYGLAVLARFHGIRFMVAAPVSTIDAGTASGTQIPIELRPGRELTEFVDRPVAAAGVDVFNPVFDVTPARLVDVLVTEKGIVEYPDEARIGTLLQSP